MIPSRLSAADEQRLNELLPWYVNGTLDDDAKGWVENIVANSKAAAAALAREKNLSTASESMLLPVIAQDLGLAQLRARIKVEARGASPARAPADETPLWNRVLQWLARPQWAMAMMALVVVQAGTIGWLTSNTDHDNADSATRSVGVAQVHTLRVSFRPGASEVEIRAALVNAAARIVGGPTQMGEYWVASDLTSLDEIRAALLKSNIVASMEVDLAGPRGQ
jgi:hypothetical protein